ncbi:MAG: methyltransferase domain-containing protein [Acidaminococcaceae bacterium]|nr:methyltransferase domain-containing protein [Acidaminococcaceae bacterium]
MKDQVMPEGKWEFNQEVTNCFDEMLERSIPAYADMRELVKRIGKRYVKRKTAIVDLGCSTGEAILPFVSTYGCQNTYKLYDVSEPMLEACREKFKNWINEGYLTVEEFDIRKGLPEHLFTSLVLSVLTLQFTPIEYRQKIIQSVYDSLEPGGALILVEKVLGSNNAIDTMLVDEYYRIKAENAYTQEQISAKRKSLEGVLVPITARWNEEMLKEAGFRSVDCFWRYLNFAGWVAVK